jgi:hypothetical protein
MVSATGPNNIFLTQQVHKEALVDLGVKLWESTSCAGVNSWVKHSRVRKYQLKLEYLFKRFHLLNSRLFGGGSFHGQNRQFFVKRVEQLQYHLDSKTSETHNMT